MLLPIPKHTYWRPAVVAFDVWSALVLCAYSTRGPVGHNKGDITTKKHIWLSWISDTYVSHESACVQISAALSRPISKYSNNVSINRLN